MSTINYTYNVIVDRFRQFAAGHFQLRRFTHGEISQADLEKEAEWPWMHVKPRAINYAPGTRAFSFEIFISDLPRDKEDKTGYQAESITDCSLIFQDLINEIHLGHMFGDDVVLTRPVNSEPFVEQYTHTLTGVTGIIELNLDYDWSACSIPASWNYNTPTNSPSDGWGALQFIESLDQNGVFVSLLNDLESPGNSYYYGTDGSGVKGWYAIVDNIGLTCETLPDCAVIIGIVDDIIALQTDVALKANSADLGATAFSNDYNDLDNLPTLPTGTVTSIDLTAGTGISVSGGPITSSGSITVTNSAPDQVVGITAGTGIGVTGTYPNFTVTNSAPSSGGTVTSVGTTGLISGGPITTSGTITTSMATNKLVGRYSASTGIMEEVTIGSGLTLTGAGVLNNTATPTPTGYYGAWQDNVTQTAAASNTGYPMIFRTIDLENQVRVVTNGTNLTRITFDNTGIYNLQFSSQFQNLSNSPQDVTIWLRLNGVDVSGSAGVVGLEARKNPSDPYHIVSGWNYLLNAVAGQYYELLWSTTDHTNVQMKFYAAGSPPPSAASVILTVTQQAGIMAGTGITAINSLTGAVQTLATGTSGTDFAISSTGTSHTFNLPTASAANRGALSSADWSTFNGKFNLPALTSGSVLFSNGTTIAQDNANLFWDDTNNRLGIGTATPATTLQIAGTTTTQSIIPSTHNTYDLGTLANRFKSGYFNGTLVAISTYTNSLLFGVTNLGIYNSLGTQVLQFFGTGNLLLQNGGTFTDAGFKLDVNGTARISGLTRSTEVFVVGGTATTNTANARFWSSGGQAPTSGLFRGFYTDISWIPSSGSAEFYALDLRPTINQTGTANAITRGLYIAPTLTSATDFRAIEVTAGITILGASTTAKASLRIPSGTAPTSPVNGDIWFDGTNIKMQIGGVTKTFTLL